MPSKIGSNIRLRQYRLSVSTLNELYRYCNEVKKNKSEVVEMAIKEFLKKDSAKNLVLCGVMLSVLSSGLWAVPGLDTITEQGLIDKLGKIIKMIAGVAAPIVLSLGLLVGGIKYHNGDEEAISYIKGGVIGAIICFAAWALANMMMDYLGG